MSVVADDLQVKIRPADQPGDLGWVVMAHGEVYAEQFGWDTSFEVLVAQIVADYAGGHDEAREAAWIAELGRRRVGCVFCVTGDEPAVAKLRILLVAPEARGHGVGRRLVDECLRFAETAGYRQVTLWTNDVLTSARRIYEAAGFTLADQEPHHSFGHDLVGQTWAIDLPPPGGPDRAGGVSTSGSPAPSARRDQLLEAAYRQVLTHGLTGMSLRPLAKAIGSSPRVLLYLFGSKDGLVRALLARARADELALLERVATRPDEGDGPAAVAARVWTWLARPEHRALLTLWVEAYARSLVEPDGPWGGFARDTVDDWLRVLADDQPAPDTPAARAQRTVALAVLRGALLDLLATGDLDRVDAAVTTFLRALDPRADLATTEE